MGITIDVREGKENTEEKRREIEEKNEDSVDDMVVGRGGQKGQ